MKGARVDHGGIYSVVTALALVFHVLYYYECIVLTEIVGICTAISYNSIMY